MASLVANKNFNIVFKALQGGGVNTILSGFFIVSVLVYINAIPLGFPYQHGPAR